MRERSSLGVVLAMLSAIALATPGIGATQATPGGATSRTPADAAEYAASSNTVKAHALVDAAINMTDSDRAVKILWQATELDPTLEEAYVYLGLFYNSRSQFEKVIEVYQKLVKYQPKEISAYLNIGEAYMSFSPPKYEAALPYYRKALELDNTSSFAALRMGEIFAQQGNREEAVRYLRLASGDRSKNPTIATEADRMLRQMGPS